jgi:hypothetical protein
MDPCGATEHCSPLKLAFGRWTGNSSGCTDPIRAMARRIAAQPMPHREENIVQRADVTRRRGGAAAAFRREFDAR